MTIAGRHHTKRIEAGEHLIALVTDRQTTSTGHEPFQVGQLAGLDVHGRFEVRVSAEIHLLVPDANIDRRYVANAWPDLDPARLTQTLERSIRDIPATIADLQASAAAATQEVRCAEARLGQPWNMSTGWPTSAAASTTSTRR
jgi:hypothetical protein